MKFVFSGADRFTCELGLEENRFHPIVPRIRIEELNGLTDLTNYPDVAGQLFSDLARDRLLRRLTG